MSLATSHVWNGARRLSLLALILACSACAAGVPGEITAAACSTPTIDEDHDDLIDCEDPDCHGFEHCREPRNEDPPPSTGGTGGMTNSGGAGGSGGSEPVAGGMDGSTSDDAGEDVEPVDAGDDMSMVDAADPEPPPCGGSCGVGAECDLATNMCVPTGVTGGDYTITVLSATAPRETPIAQCVDPCQGTAVWCPCPADPFVRVVRLRMSGPDDPPEEEEILKTATQHDNEAPTFSEAPTAVELLMGDVLRFELWQDMLLRDQLVYECTPDLAEVEPGELACTAMSGGAGSEEFTIRARLDAALN